jgi:hopanoid biosynthesis associated RND transporter like protein HpnN
MKRLTDDSTVAKILSWMAQVVIRHRRFFIYSQVALFVICILYTVKHLQFDLGRENLVGSNKKYQRDFRKFKDEFPQQADLVVVVESENEEKNRQFVERLGVKLDAAKIRIPVRPSAKETVETNLYADVFYKGDLNMMGSKALLFVPEAKLEGLKKKLQDFRPFILQFTRTTNLVSLFDMINAQFRTAKREQSAQGESLVNTLPAIERIVTQGSASLHRPGTPPSPGITALFDAGDEAEQQTYITFAQGRIFLVNAHALTDELTGDALLRLRQLVAETKIEVPGLNVGITGEPVLEHDEMAQSQKDTTIASVVSLVICALIFIYGYNETGRPIKATICLVVGLAYTFAFATLTIGHLNILTITFLPMLIGLAIDFGVHLITRYEEELRQGKSEEAALTKAMVFTGQGIFTGAFTTAGAFLAMGFTNFRGIQEMGIICGGGLLICLIPMMTLLPVLLLRGQQNVLDHLHGKEPQARARIENIWLDRPVMMVSVIVTLTGLAALQLHKVYFDYNLLHMQSAGLPAVEFEQKLINSAGKSVLFGAIIATNLEEALTRERQITNLSSVAKKGGVISMAGFLSGEQTAKLRLIGEIKQELAGIRFNEPDLRPVNIPELSLTLYSLYGYLGAALDDIGTNQPALGKQLDSLRNTVEGLRKELYLGDAAAQEARAQKLAAYQQALFNDVRETFQALQHQDNSAPLRAEDLPKALRDRFVGMTGKYLLQVYPEKDVWQRENQKEFISQLRTIDPDVTGTPVQLFEYTELLKRSYEQAALYSLGAIVILVIIHFRSLSSVVLSLLPVAIGSIWLGGLMGYFNIPFNPANIMTLPLVLGIGVTNGIHILNRFAEEQHASILARSTGKAVFVSGLTAIAGFGSLVLAQHQGIRSLGYVMAAGVTTCMIAGLTFLPALLNLTLRRRPQIKQPGADNALSTPGREEPRQKDLK